MTDSAKGAVLMERREVLKLTGIIAGLSWIGVSTQPATAAVQDEANFLTVSKTLTGKQDLAVPFASALLAAFHKNDPSFDRKLAQLRHIIGDAPIDSETLKAKLSGASPDLAGLPQLILTGWYLGIVGGGETAICVAYVDALANRALADVLRPQSYSYGAYGSWASKPA